MQRRVLILGGYGNFGKRIAASLTAAGISVVIAGRDKQKGEDFAKTLPRGYAETAQLNVAETLDGQLSALDPTVVIDTCGPFQHRNYSAALSCIRCGISYVDLADGRAFVNGISSLDRQARDQGVAVISGASTLPALSSAVIEHFRSAFTKIDRLVYGISPGQKTDRGLATTKAVLSYVGRPLKPYLGSNRAIYGWQDIFRQRYPGLGKRWMANCDIPDLDLFPDRYGIGSMRFSAGLELGLLHLGLWGLSWLIRWGAPLDLPAHAAAMLRVGNWLNRFGSADGGMHVILNGANPQDEPIEKRWYLIARNGHGPHVPTVPAIVLAKRAVTDGGLVPGAYPCVGLVTLDEYLWELSSLDITTITE